MKVDSRTDKLMYRLKLPCLKTASLLVSYSPIDQRYLSKVVGYIPVEELPRVSTEWILDSCWLVIDAVENRSIAGNRSSLAEKLKQSVGRSVQTRWSGDLMD